MDVKYHQDQWQKVEYAMRELTQSYSSGVFSLLESINDNLEKAQEKIAKYDTDGVANFSYTERAVDHRALNSDYTVLQEYGSKVGGLIEQKIDQPFFEDMDKFVTTMRDASIENYTTTNRIGATNNREITHETGTYEYDLDKEKVDIHDLFNGDSYYANKMLEEFIAVKNQSDNNDINYDDYRNGMVSSGAFQYKSIEDGQMSKEFWVNLGLGGVTLLASIYAPPVGVILIGGTTGLEGYSAISGKDWLTQRDMDDNERMMRGGFALIGTLPLKSGASAVRSFGSSKPSTSVLELGSQAKTSGKSMQEIADTNMLSGPMLQSEAGQVKNASQQADSVMRNDKVTDINDFRLQKVLEEKQNNLLNYTDQILPATGTDGVLAMSKGGGKSGSVMYNSGPVNSVEVGGVSSGGVVGKGTGKYNTGTIKHIYHGEINRRGKAVGYHHESMMGGKMIPGTEKMPDKNGVYMAKVEIDGVRKVADSSFFPKEWNRVDVLKAIDEAYETKQQIGSNKYKGVTSSGIKIEMYLNKDGSIATAYPLYKK